MPVELRPYQDTGISFLKRTRKAILADMFGLGKTVQAIHAATPPVLVACPTYLVDQWQDAVHDELPGTLVAVCHDTRQDRQLVLDTVAGVVPWTVINIEMLRSYVFPRKYNTLIVDEAHHVRGHTALQSKNAAVIAARTPFVYLLTATPIKTEVDDVYMLLHILDPKNFSSYERFKLEYCKVASNGFANKVVGAKDPEKMRALLRKYMLRRTYKTANLALPEAIQHPVRLTPSKNWYDTYRRLKKNYRLADITFDSASEVVRTLQRLTFDLKLDVCKQILADNPEAIFYVYYRESAQELAKHLDIPAIDGGMQPEARKLTALANKAVVATIKSLSEGIDLTSKNTIVFVEQSYEPGDRQQALARLVRWSHDTRPVGVFDVAVQKTVDTTISTLLARRQADAMSVLRTELADA